MQTYTPRPYTPPESTPRPPIMRDPSKTARNILIVLCVLFAVFILATATQLNKRDSRIVGVSEEIISIDSLRAGQTVRPPFTIAGTALSDWYNNGVFPVQVYDSNNNLLATTYAVAELTPLPGEQTRFAARIEAFDVLPETRIGRIILHKQILRDKLKQDNFLSVGVSFDRILGAKGSTGSTSKTTTTKSSTASSASSSLYARSGLATCGDGYDNDSDGRRDSADPDCHSDGNPNLARTFDSNRDEDPGYTRTSKNNNTNSGNSSPSGANNPFTNTSSSNTTTSTTTTYTNSPKDCGGPGLDCFGFPQ